MTNPDNKSDWSHISEGVRDLVITLNNAGFETTDSGDGTNFKNGMEHALPYRHVFGVLRDGKDTDDIRACAEEIHSVIWVKYPSAMVEISYTLGGSTIFMVFPDGHKDWDTTPAKKDQGE